MHRLRGTDKLLSAKEAASQKTEIKQARGTYKLLNERVRSLEHRKIGARKQGELTSYRIQSKAQPRI